MQEDSQITFIKISAKKNEVFPIHVQSGLLHLETKLMINKNIHGESCVTQTFADFSIYETARNIHLDFLREIFQFCINQNLQYTIENSYTSENDDGDQLM